MSLRKLNGTAYSVAHQFAISSEYFFALAIARHVPKLRIDLLSGAIDPLDFEMPRTRRLVTRCSETLSRALGNVKNIHLTSAILIVDLDLARAAPSIRFSSFGTMPAVYTVTLEDAKGRSWHGVLQRYDALVAAL